MKKFFSMFLIVPIIVFTVVTDVCSENRMYKELRAVHDYEYLKNRYFFVGDSYRNRFETGLSFDLLHFTLDAWTQIMDLQVWVASSSTAPGALPGMAVAGLEPDGYFGEDALRHKGHFKPLSKSEYKFDGDRGYFWLTESADSKTVLAVSYLLKDKKIVGTMASSENRPASVLLKLIKPADQNATPEYAETWPLMMKNVYDLGRNLAGIKYINLLITNGDDPVTKAGTYRNGYLNTFGLDMIDECRYFMRKGDGIVDFNSFNLNLHTGILIFPGIHPFNPLMDSRFQISEAKKADIYNAVSADALKTGSKYKITVIDMIRPQSETASGDYGKNLGDG